MKKMFLFLSLIGLRLVNYNSINAYTQRHASSRHVVYPYSSQPQVSVQPQIPPRSIKFTNSSGVGLNISSDCPGAQSSVVIKSGDSILFNIEANPQRVKCGITIAATDNSGATTTLKIDSGTLSGTEEENQHNLATVSSQSRARDFGIISKK